MYRTVLYFAVILGLATPATVTAAETGGLPALDTRVSALETVVTSLQTLVTTLQTNVATLQTSVTTLQTANSDLKTALDAEIAARKAGDAALKAALDAEVAARKLSDADFLTFAGYVVDKFLQLDGDITGLSADIAAASAKGRTYAGPSLATFLPNGDMTVISSLTLPAGNYYVAAKTNVLSQMFTTDFKCYLYVNGAQQVDRGIASLRNLELTNDNVYANMKLNTLLALSAPAKIDFQCESGVSSSSISNIKLIALEVGQPQ